MKGHFYIYILIVVTAKSYLFGSQSEGYLKSLAPTRLQAYGKVKKFLVAPDPLDWSKRPLISVNSSAFEPFTNDAIEVEKNNPNYYAFYHSSAKEGILLTLLRTYINQQENDWKRDDFFILREPEFFYKNPANTAGDYIQQNKDLVQQYHDYTDPNNDCARPIDLKRCRQLDFNPPYRDHLISTSPAFIAGVDTTDIEQRHMNEMDYSAWESSFYYFATNLSWSNIRRLFSIVVSDLKTRYPSLFTDSPINNQVRKYIAINFNKVVTLLFPHKKQRLTPQEQLFAKTGMMFQFLIPKNIVNDVAYLSWANGIIWQRKINSISNGWDDTVGTYTQISPILDIMRTDPAKLGNAINLLQARLIYKDKNYFYSPDSPIKINLIHTLPESSFRIIKDYLQAIAYVVVANNKAIKNNTQQTWFEESNIAHEVQKNDEKINTLLKSSNENDLITALSQVYYFITIGSKVHGIEKIAEKYKNSTNKELSELSKDILNAISHEEVQV